MSGARAAAGSLSLTDGWLAGRWVRRSPLRARQCLARAHFKVSSKVSSTGMHSRPCPTSCLAVHGMRARSRDTPAAPLAWLTREASCRASLARVVLQLTCVCAARVQLVPGVPMVVKSDPHMDKAVRLVRPAAPFHPPPTHARAPLRALPPQLRCRGAQMVEAVMSAREAYQAVQVRGEKCLQNLRKRKKLALVKQEAASPDERAAKPAAVAKPADGRRRRIIFFTPAARPPCRVAPAPPGAVLGCLIVSGQSAQVCISPARSLGAGGACRD